MGRHVNWNKPFETHKTRPTSVCLLTHILSVEFLVSAKRTLDHRRGDGSVVGLLVPALAVENKAQDGEEENASDKKSKNEWVFHGDV